MTLRKSVLVVLLTIALVSLAAACTSNQRARSFGGTMTKDLPPGQKLVLATWKEQSLWFLTRPMRLDESPETYTFQEDSSLGLVQGTVVFREHAQK